MRSAKSVSEAPRRRRRVWPLPRGIETPPGAGACETQTPSVAELSKGRDGCDETLNWWVTTYLEELRNPPKRAKPKGPPPRNAKTYTLSDLPRQCRNVLASR